ncbi:RNA polymerase sigma factor [Chitinophaga cymbidii]|uniref:DNA-directed RNA polymerase sigma-70 factor n=1 Tax=Chitinophaga cymbidii TaxID=1096750 RepID=A0A512RQT1_9BACT|nr:sigma-70 family RNA polymerase sigma factor [Chitinophaga cymbidii]GEP98073.1 DNA-directed RNA polymerase sigma-70 factor [Chitinophaga cymbidii]
MENTALIYRHEKALFERIAEGDEDAFNALFHAYVPLLHELVMKVTGKEWMVKDIIQEVFLYLWLDREKLIHVEVPRNWIFKIAYNRSYSWLARQAARDRKAQEWAPLQEGAGNEATEHELAFQETSRLIREATSLLPVQARRIFQLSREEGLRPGEIAAELGLSVQTVRNSLVRSVKSVKSYLARKGIILPALLIMGLL